MAASTTAAPTSALAELTPAQIQQQASSQVAQQYAPVYTGLDQQQAQLNALGAKRAADDAYYRDWISAQNAKLQSASQTFETGIATQQAQTAANLRTDFAGSNAQSLAGMQNRAGTVSNMGQDTSVSSLQSGEQNRGQALYDTARQSTSDMLTNQDTRLTSSMANGMAVAAANQAKNTAATWTAITNLANTRSADQVKQAAATTALATTLGARNVSVANANRNFDVAAAKLGVSQQNATSLTASRKAAASAGAINAAANSSRAATAAQVANQNNAYHNATLALDWYRAQHPKAPAPASRAQMMVSNTQYAFDTAFASLAGSLLPKDATGKQPPMTAAYARGQQAQLANQLMASLHVNSTVANAVVQRYIDLGGNTSAAPLAGLSPGAPQASPLNGVVTAGPQYQPGSRMGLFLTHWKG